MKTATDYNWRVKKELESIAKENKSWASLLDAYRRNPDMDRLTEVFVGQKEKARAICHSSMDEKYEGKPTEIEIAKGNCVKKTGGENYQKLVVYALVCELIKKDLPWIMYRNAIVATPSRSDVQRTKESRNWLVKYEIRDTSVDDAVWRVIKPDADAALLAADFSELYLISLKTKINDTAGQTGNFSLITNLAAVEGSNVRMESLCDKVKWMFITGGLRNRQGSVGKLNSGPAHVGLFTVPHRFSTNPASDWVKPWKPLSGIFDVLA